MAKQAMHWLPRIMVRLGKMYSSSVIGLFHMVLTSLCVYLFTVFNVK